MSAPTLKSYRVRFQETTCYGLDIIAKSESDAIDAATEKFYGLSVAERADAIIWGSPHDLFKIVR